MVTHSLVLAELIPLAARRSPGQQVAVKFVDKLFNNRAVKVVWVDELRFKSALRLLQNRADKQYSLCDAVSFQIMREVRVYRALTTDQHFDQEGFQRLLNR